VSAPLRTVHVRIDDAGTGKPTPVRIRFSDPAGNYFAPLGRLADFATTTGQDVGGNVLIGSEKCSYIDGNCEVKLPAGNLRVQVSKGFEYTPLDRDIALAPGQLALRLNIERWIDLRAEGWYSGDARAHFLSPHGALLEAAAEDLAVVDLLAMLERGEGARSSSIPNILAFSGQCPALQSEGHMVVVNTLNQHPALGRLGLLNAHRIVFPLSFGGPDEVDDWTLSDWCDQCHRKGGLVVWAEPDGEEPDGAGQGEALADLVLGKIDALEVSRIESMVPEAVGRWYHLLGAGFRVPLVGASAKTSNATPLGSIRTYAQLPKETPFTYKAWIESIRAGRSCVSNGPLLRLCVNGKPPGTLLDVPAGKAVHVRADARSLRPFSRLEIIFKGQSISKAEPCGSPRTALIDEEVVMESGGWLAARCSSDDVPTAQGVRWGYAHTSPTYVRVGGVTPKPDGPCVAALLSSLKATSQWIQRASQLTQRDRLLDSLHRARIVLEQLLDLSGG
jgi:hypothetical protein